MMDGKYFIFTLLLLLPATGWAADPSSRDAEKRAGHSI
jgi:hypothetical protein